MYEAPGPEISFGDIFAADWFFDAYLRRDAVPLQEFNAKVGKGWKVAVPSQQRDTLFAHGQQRQAILLSENCEVDTILSRGGRSRLVFAAIEQLPPSKTAADEALAVTAFRRFPLPPEGSYAGGIVEFQQLFAMATDGVVKAEDSSDPRVARLDDEARVAFEMRWNAYAVRRGPLSHLDNAEKLARLLAADGDSSRLAALKTGTETPSDELMKTALALAEALAAAWNIEGEALTEVAEAYERGDSPEAVRASLSEALADLASRAQRARAFLDNL